MRMSKFTAEQIAYWLPPAVSVPSPTAMSSDRLPG